MTIKAIGAASPDWGLDDLAAFIWGNEIVWGQASQIGNDGETTVVVFDRSHVPVPTDNTVHVAVVREADDAPANAKALLCSGEAIFRAEQDREVTAVKVFRI
ncbi:hypothetical protein EWE75_17760 [Sphingomonas populi]|uniref:Uncharacterized protein n=1 Tax=Sphingomonas populi TaxID=2484750 RepID=A0A4Q6Y1L1_9SPHN|nr:hypothetical protein [Sphingomonas populi]RZF63159.1 hypothetical protein EWE75_17760 [Sphingomonas populi]